MKSVSSLIAIPMLREVRFQRSKAELKYNLNKVGATAQLFRNPLVTGNSLNSRELIFMLLIIWYIALPQIQHIEHWHHLSMTLATAYYWNIVI